MGEEEDGENCHQPFPRRSLSRGVGGWGGGEGVSVCVEQLVPDRCKHVTDHIRLSEQRGSPRPRYRIRHLAPSSVRAGGVGGGGGSFIGSTTVLFLQSCAAPTSRRNARGSAQRDVSGAAHTERRRENPKAGLPVPPGGLHTDEERRSGLDICGWFCCSSETRLKYLLINVKPTVLLILLLLIQPLLFALPCSSNPSSCC